MEQPPLTRVHYKDNYDLFEGDLPNTFTDFKNQCLQMFDEKGQENFYFEVSFFDKPKNITLNEKEYSNIKRNSQEIIEFLMINIAEKNAFNKEIEITNENFSVISIQSEHIKIPYGVTVFEFTVCIANNGRKSLKNASLKWDKSSDLISFDYTIKQELNSSEKIDLHFKCTSLDKRIKPEDVGKTKKVIWQLVVGNKVQKSKLEIIADIIEKI